MKSFSEILIDFQNEHDDFDYAFNDSFETSEFLSMLNKLGILYICKIFNIDVEFQKPLSVIVKDIFHKVLTNKGFCRILVMDDLDKIRECVLLEDFIYSGYNNYDSAEISIINKGLKDLNIHELVDNYILRLANQNFKGIPLEILKSISQDICLCCMSDFVVYRISSQNYVNIDLIYNESAKDMDILNVFHIDGYSYVIFKCYLVDNNQGGWTEISPFNILCSDITKLDLLAK